MVINREGFETDDLPTLNGVGAQTTEFMGLETTTLDSKPPRVSVMVPVYNVAPYLAATLESILRQTMTDFELIAIDDGSTDASPRMLQEFAKRDRRIRATVRENRGIVSTRNEMLAQARGQYLVVNDSDDISLPDRLARQVAFLDAHPDVVCVGGAFDMIDAAGRRLTTLRPPTDDAEIQHLALRGSCSICHSTAMMRRSAVDHVGGYNKQFTYAHDLELWLRLGEVGRLANLDSAVTQFRLHGGSVSENKRYEQRNFCKLACEQAWDRRGLTDVKFEASEPWRPGKDRDSRHEYALKYGWWAFNSGERRTAALYASKAIAAKPTRPGGWKLFACALVKPTPESA